MTQKNGLKYEEPLLWELTPNDGGGTDFSDCNKFENRTGLSARSDIGLNDLSESQIVRHFVRLSTQNYSIDHGFFPLGSCTMKHNPRINEKLARLDGFANIHPLQDKSTVQGALELMHELQFYLSELTGLQGVCMSPAAGAHGELAGILTIKEAHKANGEAYRDIMLIPDSAHGTNPATAAMCGYKIKVVSTRENGRIDMKSFKEALGDGKNIAGMMVTNPNTCGLFETDIIEFSDLLHKAGGYFYCDGANFNALVGRIKPADFGVDVMHINLHKTFSTPHGGGGPGSGPICVTKELEPYLPIPISVKTSDGTYKLSDKNDQPETLGVMRGFIGQFGMFVRALAYMKSHGADGLKQVSGDAVLSANYILANLKDIYHVPFEGFCMHECLFTDKKQKENGVTTLDIAKTICEHGMHPMTIYFPLVVDGAMLIEPTETEPKSNLDDFISIMKNIAIDTKDSKSETMKSYPISTPRKKLDELKAAISPILSSR